MSVPLFDRNGIFLRHIGEAEALNRVETGNAIPVTKAGTWRDRNDLEWTGCQIIDERELIWSRTSLNDEDMKAVAGELGDCIETRVARLKFRVWKEVH